VNHTQPPHQIIDKIDFDRLIERLHEIKSDRRRHHLTTKERKIQRQDFKEIVKTIEVHHTHTHTQTAFLLCYRFYSLNLQTLKIHFFVSLQFSLEVNRKRFWSSNIKDSLSRLGQLNDG
jgi:hypothetical protein